MNISKIKIIWKFLVGGREAVLDYVLEVANTLVAKIETAKQDEIKGYLAQAESILGTLDRYSWLCPQKWLKAYTLTIAAFADIVAALKDLNVTAEEIDGIVTAFKSAFVAWHTTDDADANL